jgi:tetratricopeptide (TPR) repeat protein
MQAALLNPNDVGSHYHLGLLLGEAGNDKEAALQLEPNSVGVYANMAQALTAVGRTDEALAAVQKGIKIARSTGNPTETEKLDEWMKDFQADLERSRQGESPSQPRPPADEPKQSQ